MSKVISLLAQLALTIASGIMIFSRKGVERIAWLLLFLGFGVFFVIKAWRLFSETMENYQRELTVEAATTSTADELPPIGNMMGGHVEEGEFHEDKVETDVGQCE